MSSGRKRFVFDTSTLIGAVLRPLSKPSKALQLAGEAGELLASFDTLAELRHVLARSALNRYRDPQARSDFLALYRASVLDVDVSISVTDCRDPKDDKFHSLALAGGADFIVSSDNDLLVMHPYRGIAILSPADLLVLADARKSARDPGDET